MHFTNAVGCDSAAILNLTVLATSFSITNTSICPSALPYSWNGNSYSVSGSDTLHFTNSVGCDSAAILNLTVLATSSSVTNISICSTALPYTWNGNSYSAAGSDTVHFTNAAGCDSAAILNLSLLSPLIVEHWQDVLIFDNSSNNYTSWQWYLNNSPISNANGQYYSSNSPLNGSYYAMAVNKNGDTITTCTLNITAGGISSGINLAPNPVNAGSQVNIVSNYTTAQLQGAMMTISNITGSVWKQINSVSPNLTISAPTVPGIYVVTILFSDGQKTSLSLLVK